jgi:DNA-binding NarL/FixJ family response regulator
MEAKGCMAKTQNMAALSAQEWALLERDLSLSPRQVEIMKLISRGMSDKQIAWQLSISFYTVRSHMSRLFRKCNVNDRLELLAQVYVRLHRHWRNHESVASPCEDGADSGFSLWAQS